MPAFDVPLQSECFYHICHHAIGEENLFRTDQNYQFFLEKYSLHLEPVTQTFAYCLMPNHIHFLVRVRDEKTLLENLQKSQLPKLIQRLQNTENEIILQKYVSQSFSNLFNSYTQAFNKKYGRKGGLFRQNFRRWHIQNDDYLTNVICYIHRNPVHHGFTRNADEWKFSSFQAFLSEKKTRLARNEVLDWFGNRKAFQNAHFQELGKDLEEIEF